MIAHRETRTKVGAIWRWNGALAYFLGAQLLFIPAVSSAQAILPDGRTQTSVSTSGAVSDVHTASTSGANAFNSFHRFNVDAGTTANLHLPAGSANLINIVRDQRTDIYGMLNAVQDGRIGGNVFFANPHGFVVGASGIVNVGSLAVATPTQQFVDTFFVAPDTPDDAAVVQLLSGAAPRGGSGLISIQGRVNAAEGVALSAGSINVGGAIFSGARFLGSLPDFSDVVNANGLASASNVVVREGRVSILADHDVAVSGTIAATGGSGVRGGDISLHAGGSLELASGAHVSARGNGPQSHGGTVNVWAEDRAVARQGALIDASAGLSGDGGSIEFSARREVELAGGEFRADGTGGGRGGSVLIDPASIMVSAHLLRGASGYGALPAGGSVSGASLTLLADESISVGNDVVISSRLVDGSTVLADHTGGISTGASGNITLRAPEIAMAGGSQLLAHADGGHAGGDIFLDAARTGGNFDFSSIETGISLAGATLKGRDITLSASSSYASTVMPVVVQTVRATVDIDSSLLEASRNIAVNAAASLESATPALLPFAAIDATSQAAVDVRGSASLVAGQDATLSATSAVSASAIADMPDIIALPADAGVAVVLVDSQATVDVRGASTLDIGGVLEMSATNTVSIEATADASPAGPVAIGATLALAVVDTTTRAALGEQASLSQSGSVSLSAESVNTVLASATAAANGASDQGDDGGGTPVSRTQQALGDYQSEASTSDGGVEVAAAVAIVDLESATAAYMASSQSAGSVGAVRLSSRSLNQSTVSADGSTSGGGVGVGAAVAVNVARVSNDAYVAQAIDSAGLSVAATMAGISETNVFSASATSGAGASNVGVAGSVAVNVVESRTRALITGEGAVHAGGGDVELLAENTSESTAEAKPADGGSTGDTLGIGASVAVNVATNESRAALEDAGQIHGAGNLTLSATGAHAMTTTAEAGAEGGIGLTPVVAVSVADNFTTARLGTGAALTLGGALEISATHSGRTTTSAAAEVAGEKVAVGASVAVNVVSDAATALVARSVTSAGGIDVAAVSASSASASAKASAKGGKGDENDGGADDAPDDGVDQQIGRQADLGKDKQASGNNNSSQQSASAETSEGKVSVAAGVSVNVVDSRAEASIADGQSITAGGALGVLASNNTDAEAVADATASGSSQVGIGAAVSINTVKAASAATLGNGATSAEGISVRSAMTDVSGDTTNTFSAQATSGAAGEKVGIAGSLALNIIDASSTAQIAEGAVVDADGSDPDAAGGDVTVSAASRSTTKAEALPDESGAAGGKVGVGASVAVNTFTQDLTRARIGGNASVSNADDVTVSASSQSDTEATAQAGAAGSVAVDAVVALSLTKQTTEAILAPGAALAATGAISVSATAGGAHVATATGDVKSDKVAIGASAAIILSDTSTKASLERSATSGGDLTVAASATRTYEAVAKASAGGGKDADETSQAEKDNARSTSTLKDNESAQSGTEKTGSSSKVNVAAAAGVLVIDDDVEASIAAGSTLQAGGDLAVSAFNSSDFSARGLGDTLDITKLTGGSTVGIGVGVGLAIVRNDTVAAIGDNSHILEAGAITVQAESKQNASDAFKNKLAAEGVSGAGSEKVSVAGSLAVANSNATTYASIGEGVVIDQAGAVTIEADNTSKLSAKAWSLATSGKVGVGASVAIVVSENEYKAWLGRNADLSVGSLAVRAENHRITGPVPFDIALDELPEKFTDANLQVLLGENNYYTEAIAGGGSSKVAVTGAFAVNVFDDATEAWVGEGAQVSASGAVAVDAKSETTAKAFAGGVSAAGKVGVGIASADIVSQGTTRAYLEQGVQIQQAASVSLGASSAADFMVIGASAAAAGTAGVGGVLSLVLAESLAEAYAADGATINSSGAVNIEAGDELKLLNVAGVAGIGGTAGVGVSAGVNVLENTARAWIGKNADVEAAGLTSVDATTSLDVLGVVVGGAGGGTAGVAASGAANVYTPVTQAWIDTGAKVNDSSPLASQSVRVSAQSETELLSIVGTVGIGGTAGVGGAADVVVIDKTTQAWIAGGGSDVRAGNDVQVLADSSETIRSVGVGFSAGGTAGVQGSASVLVLTTETQAYLAAGSKVQSEGNVVVAAAGESELDLLAGAIGAAGTAAVGAGAAVAVVDKTTHAWVGDGAQVTALGNRAGAQVATGAFGIAYSTQSAGAGEVDAPGITPSDGENSIAGGSEALTKTRSAASTTRTVQGLAVTAINQDDIEGFAVTGGAAGSVAVTLSGDVSVHSTDTQAWIGAGAKVNENNAGAGAGQSVLVAAGNDAYHLGIAGALAASGAVGVGVGADVAVMSHTTQAHIGAGALVNARKDVEVAAKSSQEVLSISASLGASGTVGVSGSVSVLSFDNRTWSWIGAGASVDAGGNVGVTAQDDTDTTLIAGTVALGLGGGGIGGGVGVTIIDKDTRAWIGDGATVDGRGQNTSDLGAYSGDSLSGTLAMRGVQVQAQSSEDLFTIAAAGAGGLYVGIAGAVSVATIDSDTTAFIGDGAQINTRGGTAHASQDVNVTARNDLGMFTVAGALGVGAVGIAGSVDVGVIRNDTTAFIGDSADVRAARDVDVNALSRKEIETYVISASGGLAGIAAGVAVYSVGGALDGESQDRLKSDDGETTGAYADAQATDSSITDGFLSGYSDARIQAASADVASARNATSVSGSFTAAEARTLPAGNAAFIGKNTTVSAGRHVDVDARESVSFDMITGAVAVGAVGLGAGVGVASFQNDNRAFIDDGASVTAGAAGNVTVTAQLVERLGGLGIAGTGGIVAVDAAVSILKDNSSVIAQVGDGVAIDRANLVRIEAEDERTLESETYSVSVGLVTAGASVATSSIGGTTRASIGTGAQIGQGAHQVNDLQVSADANHAASADALAGKAGLGLAASGTVASATLQPAVSASIGGGAIKVQNDVDVDAAATVSATALATGINVSLGGSVGASIANASASPIVSASLGAGTAIEADNISVDAAQRTPGSGHSVHANATGASGGLLVGANATVATATNNGQVSASVGSNSTLIASGTVHVAASNQSRQRAEAEGLSFGLLALGANVSKANSNTLTQATLGDGVKVDAGALALIAGGQDDNLAYALAGSGGAVSGLASEASTSNVSQTHARTGSGTDTRAIDVGTAFIEASHTALFNSRVDSTNASLVGASGAEARNTVNSLSEAHIGAGGYVLADTLVLRAHNQSLKPWLSDWNVKSGSGGLLDLPAATSTTTIVNNALARVGTGAYVEQTGDRNNPGAFRLDASNEVVARDKVKLDSGGAISVPSASSRIFADVNNATVQVGDNAEMYSVGDLAMGARSVADLYTQAAVDTYGIAGAPEGNSVSRFLAVNRIEIGAAKIESLQDIHLGAGRNTLGQLNNLSAIARTDLWNNTAIPISTLPDADAIIGTHSLIDIGAGAELGAVRHVSLFAEKGAAHASGIGIGKDLYREALAAVASAVSNAFGGEDVSFETRSGRSIRNQSAAVRIDGEVKVGIHRKQVLEIGANGTPTKRTEGISIVDTDFKDVAADILARIEALEDLIRQYSVDDPNADASIAVAAYRSEIRFLERKLDELGFPRAQGESGFSGVPRLSALEAAQESLAGMTTTLNGYTGERAALETQNATLTDQNATLAGQNTTLGGQNATLQSQINGLDPKDDAAQIATLTSQIQANNATIAGNTTTINANNATIADNTAQIGALTGLIDGLSGQIASVQTGIANNDYSDVAFGGPVAKFLTVSDVVAQLGNVYVRGDRLHGTGHLDAPGDAEIKITNNGPNFLVLNNLAIPPDDGGKVFFNSIDVRDNTQINAINGPVGGAAFTLHTAESQVDGAGNPIAPAQPQIVITSHYDPLDPLYTSEGYRSQLVPGTAELAPDIVMQGDISNLRGLVKVESAAGSIRLEQGASIRAGEVEIKTRNGDFVQSYVDAFFHTAGAPLFIQPGDTNLAFPGNIDSIVRSPEAAGAGIVANGSVLIAARYLNINGIIQSGIPEWGVLIPASATVSIPGLGDGTFAQAQAHYNALSQTQQAQAGAEFYTVSGATVAGLPGNLQGDWEKMVVRYNARDNRLELGGVQVQGGFIELFGQIFNTNQSGGGQLRVLDGYGQIKVDNQTSLDLVVNLLDTGRGVQGQINISNITGLDGSGQPIITTTSYVRDPNEARNGLTYDPAAGQRYVMTVGYDTVKEDFYRYSQTGWFDISATYSSLALDQYRVNSIQRSNDPLSQGEFLQQWPAEGTTQHYFGRTQTKTTSSVLTPGRSWKECNWWTLCANAKYYQEFTITTGSKTVTTDSVKGDYPIAIQYIGFDQGSIDVSGAGNVILNASINNRTGSTTVTSTGGAIVQGGELPIVGGTNVALSAASGIGASTQALQVNVDGGKLDAVSGSGEVHIAQRVGDLKVGTVGGAGVSSVVLESARNLLGWEGASYVQGQRVELIARNGGIGELTDTINDPFVVRTGYTTNQAQWPNYGLAASARDDINIRNEADAGNAAVYSGNLLLIAAESQAGDVRIETTGTVLDNNPFSTTDQRTVQELNDLWDSMRLRGALAAQKADEAVAAFENGVTQQYHTYWITRLRQSDAAAYDAAFTFAVTNTERAQLTANGMDAAGIAAFEAAKTAEYHLLHDRLYGGGVNAVKGSVAASFVEGFRYAAALEERGAITAGASWSDAQLALSIGGGLLKDITDTVTEVKAPNAKGRNVTLIAGQGIGSFNDPVQIDLSLGLGALTPEQKAALAAAERGDATLADSVITIAQPRPVNVEVIGAGVLLAEAGTGRAFIGSEQDLRIDRVAAGAEIRIKAAGSLIDAASTLGAPNVVGGSLILESASGGIGSLADPATGAVSGPLRLSLNGGATLIARAAGGLWIEEENDLNIDTVFSRNDAQLTAAGAIADAYATADLNVLARNVFLDARAGSIGSLLNPLDVGVDSLGRIAATASVGVYLNGPVGSSFNIAEASAGTAVVLSSDVNMLIDGPVSAPGQVSLAAGADIAMTPNAALSADTIGALINAGTLTMQDGASLHVGVGTIRIVTEGDMHITGIETGNDGVNHMGGAESSIYIESLQGSIYDAGDIRLDIITDTAPAAKLIIQAAGQIGGNPLEVRLLNLDAQADAGLIHMDAQGDVNVGTMQAGGEIVFNATGALTGGTIASGDFVALQAGALIDAGMIFTPVGTALSAPSINAGVTNTGTGILQFAVAGTGGGGVANDINMMVGSPAGSSFLLLQAVNGLFTLDGPLNVTSGLVLDEALFRTPLTTVLMDNVDRSIQGGDVQLHSPSGAFRLAVTGTSVETDAFVISRAPTHHVATPTPGIDDSSALEEGNASNAVASVRRDPQADASEASADIDYSDPAVRVDCPADRDPKECL